MKTRNEKAVEIYNLIAEDYSKTYDSIDEGSDLMFLNTFISYLEKNAYIVDLGCGTGFSLRWFFQRGMFGEGCDLSSKMIRIARRNYPNIRFSVSDMRKFIPQRTADAIWAGYSLFHFEQDSFEKIIDHIRSFLKPGGIFGLVMQEGTGEIEMVQPFLINEKIYVHLYTEKDLQSILKSYKFEILEIKRKKPLHSKELPYNKLLFIARS